MCCNRHGAACTCRLIISFELWKAKYSALPVQISFPIHIQTPGAVLLFMKCEVMSRRLSVALSDLGLDLLLLLSLGELGELVLLGLGLPVVLGLLLLGTLLLLVGVLTDLLVGLLVELLKTIGLKVVVDVAGELRLVALLVVIGESLHVLSDVAGKDVLAESLSVELLGLDIETGEAVLGVRDEETTIGGTLHGTEDTGTSGGAGETDVKEDLEGAALLTVDLDGLGDVVLTISLLDTGEVLIELKLLQNTAGKEETGGVSRRPVGQTVGDAVGLELVGVRGHEDLVAGDLGGNDLSNDVLVGEADDKAVLGRIVLVLRLGDQPLTGIVIGCAQSVQVAASEFGNERTLSRAAALVLHLVPGEVGVVLDKLGLFPESAICASNPHSKQLAETPTNSRGGPHIEVLRASTQGILTVGILTCC